MATIGNLVINIVARTEKLVEGSSIAKIEMGSLKASAAITAMAVRSAITGIGTSFALNALGIKSSAGVMLEATKAYINLTAAIHRGSGILPALGRGILDIGSAWAKTIPGMVILTGLLVSLGVAAVSAASALTLAIAVPTVQKAASYEQLTMSLETIVGDAGRARTLLDEIKQFEAATPFEFRELSVAGKSLAAFGVESEAVVPTLRTLGDISAGVGMRIGELAEIYGKVIVQGRLFQEDINQFTGRGIPLAKALADEFGVTGEAVRQMVRDGKIGTAEFQRALVRISETRFGGMMEKQATTLVGLFSTLSSAIDNTQTSVGRLIVAGTGLKGFVGDAVILANALSSASDALANFVDRYQQYAQYRKGVKFFAPNPTDPLGTLYNAGSLAIAGINKFTGGKSDEKTLADFLEKINQAASNSTASKTLGDLHSEAMRLFEETRTPAEKFEKQMGAIFSGMALGVTDLTTGVRGITKAFNDLDASNPGKSFKSLRQNQELAKDWFFDMLPAVNKEAARQSAKSSLQNFDLVRGMFMDWLGPEPEEKKKKANRKPTFADNFATAAEQGSREEFNQYVKSLLGPKFQERQLQVAEEGVAVGRDQLREVRDIARSVRESSTEIVELA